jgi:uncharacterized membrane protein YvbJ
MPFCPKCGNQVTPEAAFCSKCGHPLKQAPSSSLTSEQLSQVRLEVIWTKEKTVPKALRGLPQARVAFGALEKGLTDSEKQYLKHKRDTE